MSMMVDPYRFGFASYLSGLSWQLPCGAFAGNGCACSPGDSEAYALSGNPAVTYNVNFRVRGVVELNAYTGGTLYDAPYVQKDPTGFPAFVNQYSLQVSDPPATYYLNKGVFDPNDIGAVDYEVTIPIKGGATVTLTSNTEDDAQIRNIGAHSVADDDPAHPIVVAQPYNGQFMQIDVLAIS